MSQQINLYETRLRPHYELASGRNLGIATLFLLIALGAAGFWMWQEADKKSAEAAVLKSTEESQQQKFTELSKLLAERRVSGPLASELGQARATLALRKEVLDYLHSGQLGNTTGFSPVFLGFSRLAQNDLWLTGFTVTNGGSEISLRGRLFDQGKLPPYVQKLGQEPAFQGRRFATLEMLGVVPKDDKKKTGVTAAPGPVEASLPPFIEFVLHSESFDTSANAFSTGAKR